MNATGLALMARAWMALVAADQSATAPAEDPNPHNPIASDYRLVWRDEFDGAALDPDKWSHRGLGPRRDAVNVVDAVTVADGALRITTSRVAGEAGRLTYHTGMIATADKFQPTFGYFEVRMRMPAEIGHWGAFWLMTPTIGKPVGDPAAAGTEIDVIEYHRNGRGGGNNVNHALHWDGYAKDVHKSAAQHLPSVDLHDDWHVFALEWTPAEYVFFVDGRETWRTTTAVSHRSEYLILSVEVGTWAGEIAKANLPDSLLVDYVRVWQRPAPASAPAPD